jgi:[protein-PII] uridylyltransferase
MKKMAGLGIKHRTDDYRGNKTTFPSMHNSLSTTHDQAHTGRPKMTSPLKELKKSRENLLSYFLDGSVRENFLGEYTEIIDQYFRRSLQESDIGRRLFREKRPFAFVAVGGYGRSELCLHSDIDIIILFGSKIPAQAKELSDDIFLPLWDLGLDLGYGIRTIKDCLTLSKEDFEVLTSVMDARFLCGDSPLFLSLIEDLKQKVISRKTNRFSRWLEDRDKIRLDKFGDASHLLEPHLKEGIGGLRNYHHILWLAKAFLDFTVPRDLEYLGKFSHNEYRQLTDDLDFIWLVRNYLHHLSGRKNDRLNFEFQETIAKKLGYKDQENILGVEQFMGRLHACMASIKSLHRSFANSLHLKKLATRKNFPAGNIPAGLVVHQGEICFDSAKVILSDPPLLMDIFVQSSTLDCPLSLEATRLIQEFLYLVDDTFRETNRAVQSLLKIMSRKNAAETLDQMLETGFLGAFIPEFSRISDLVQFDAYHVFPVGRHSIETVKYLNNIPTQNEILLLDMFSDLQNPEPLLLAALFHDIGKIGHEHAKKGVTITQNILKRFHYDNSKAEDILFLVGNHLLIAETATRRDLNDEKVVVQCARTIGDVERLKMLYLLTWADSKATGPRAWNEWIANLVQELFFKILHILEKKELATPHAMVKVKETRSEIRCLMADRTGNFDMERSLEVMSPRYMLNTSPHDILDHISMHQRLKERLINHEAAAFMLEAEQDDSEGYWEITFLAKDRPGLFSDIAGVLALNNINILSADIYTWRDGTAVDIFKVTEPLDPIHPDKAWNNVRRDLRSVFTGKLSLEYRLSKRRSPSILSEQKKPTHPPKVTVDNRASDFFTLIEIFTDDRVGLLYTITHTLYNLRLDIRISKIATKADQVADVFYVRDFEGQKVEDKEQIMEIKKALLHQLKQG